LNISGLANGTTEGDLILLKIGYSGFLTNSTPQHRIYGIRFNHYYRWKYSYVDRTPTTLTSGSVTYMIYVGGEIYDNEPDAISLGYRHISYLIVVVTLQLVMFQFGI
jgi:hypothetical protein